MYLSKVRKHKGVMQLDKLNVLDGYFSYIERDDKYRDDTLTQWCGVNIEDIDMELVREYTSDYVTGYYYWDEEHEHPTKSIFRHIGYWRKANAIHKWFVTNVQDGEDDCGQYIVTKEDLERLLVLCKVIVTECPLDDEGALQKDYIANAILPTADGFFFGNLKYNEWYLENIKDTIKIVADVLETTDFDNEIVIYHASW